MNEDIKKFLEQDDIDLSKVQANDEIMRNQTVEIYQATASLHSKPDISDKATKTIHWMASPLNQPQGYPVWFMIAYPDVVFWLSELVEGRTEEDALPIMGEFSEKDLDSNGKMNMSFLRKIVNVYKLTHDLECC